MHAINLNLLRKTNKSPNDLLTTGPKSAVAQWLGRFVTEARRQAAYFGLVGLCHFFRIVVFQEDINARGWHLRRRIAFTARTSLSSHEDKSNKTREVATTLQSTVKYAFTKLTLRGVYNKPVTVRGNVHWLFIAHLPVQ